MALVPLTGCAATAISSGLHGCVGAERRRPGGLRTGSGGGAAGEGQRGAGARFLVILQWAHAVVVLSCDTGPSGQITWLHSFYFHRPCCYGWVFFSTSPRGDIFDTKSMDFQTSVTTH